MMIKSACKYLGWKVIRLLSLLFVLTIITFILVSHSPIDPIQAYIGDNMMRVSSEQREQIAEYWGLNDSGVERYFHWLSALLHGDLGTSMIYQQPVSTIIKEKFINSFSLMTIAWVLSGLIGFILGVIAAIRRDSWIDRLIKWAAYTIASTPSFWVGLIFIIIFAVWLGWLPVGLGVPSGILAENVTLAEKLKHLILPALTLSFVGVSSITLHTREKLIDVLESDYILFARARGEKGWVLFWRHGLRNISIPALTLQFASFGELFGGAVLAEQVFSYPGLGQATIQSGLRGDIPLLMAIVLFSAIFVFIGNALADILYRLLDPRIKGEHTA